MQHPIAELDDASLLLGVTAQAQCASYMLPVLIPWAQFQVQQQLIMFIAALNCREVGCCHCLTCNTVVHIQVHDILQDRAVE